MSDHTETVEFAPERDARRGWVIPAAAAIALALLTWFLVPPMLAGDENASVELTTQAAAAVVTAPDDDVAAASADDAPVAEAGDELPLVTYEVFLDRDPFEAVVPEPTSASTSSTSGEGTTVDGGTTTGDGTIDTDGGTTDGTGGEPTSPAPTEPPTTDDDDNGGASCRSGEMVTCDGRAVSVIEIREGEDGELVAVVQVDTTIYEVRQGDSFAGSFVVASITETEVGLFYGDEPVERLREGDRVLK